MHVMLRTRWSGKAWSMVRVEFRWALALRSEIRRASRLSAIRDVDAPSVPHVASSAVTLLMALDASYQEHAYCGELHSAVEDDRVWMTCTCGAVIIARPWAYTPPIVQVCWTPASHPKSCPFNEEVVHRGAEMPEDGALSSRGQLIVDNARRCPLIADTDHHRVVILDLSGHVQHIIGAGWKGGPMPPVRKPCFDIPAA